VHGQLGDAAGVFPPGTWYSAHDPTLLAWVHATLLEMNVRVYELYVGPLSMEEKDSYCAEATAMEAHLRMPEGRLPRTAGELRRYVDAMLAGGEIAVTDAARSLASAVVYPPAPRIAAPAIAWMRLVTVGLLPPAIRAGYGFSWSSRHEAMFRLSASVVRNLLRLMPSIVRHWPAARSAGRAAPRCAMPLMRRAGLALANRFDRSNDDGGISSIGA
jgi:uncharacterized protein (DUF2236 family)